MAQEDNERHRRKPRRHEKRTLGNYGFLSLRARRAWQSLEIASSSAKRSVGLLAMTVSLMKRTGNEKLCLFSAISRVISKLNIVGQGFPLESGQVSPAINNANLNVCPRFVFRYLGSLGI